MYFQSLPPDICLLIVPYGIETCEIERAYTAGINLLIVPYGIETLKSAGAAASSFSFNRTLWN